LAAVCSALYHVTTPLLARTEDPANTLYFTALVAGVALSVIVPFFWMPLTASGLLGLVVIGILGTAGHFFLIRAFEIAPAATLSPFMYIYLLWATGLGWLIFSDIPGVSTILGAIIIFGSGLYVYRLPTPATGAGKLSPPAVQGPP
jgi:drug/metabolite transporter (DMT)-like permease